MYPQSADIAVLDGTGNIRCFKVDWIKRDAVILYVQAKLFILRCNRHLDDVLLFVFKSVGDNVGEQFV